MIPWPFWLTNIQFVISAFGVFAFFAAAWLNIDSWAVCRELKTSSRAVGFLLLAIWSGLHGIGLINTVMEVSMAISLFSGLALLLVSYFLDTLPLQPKELAELRRQQAKATQTLPLQPAVAKAAQASVAQRTAAATSNLRPERFLKFPAANRTRKLKLIIGTIFGIVILVLIGWGTSLIVGKLRRQESKPEPALFMETAPPAEETTEKPVAEEPTDVTTITIQDTETGFLNVREGASIGTSVIAKVNPGQSFTLLGESDEGDWFKIQVDDNIAGWVNSSYVTKNE